MIWFSKMMIYGLLLTGFILLFWQFRFLYRLSEMWMKTRQGMNAAARQRNLADRQNLLMLQEKHSFWYRLEKQLEYSGMKRRFPKITVEHWILGNLLLLAVIFITLSIAKMPVFGVLAGLFFLILQWGILRGLRIRNVKRTEENLIKLLDFLGSYSLSAGEITGILGQVSRYVDEPIKSALDHCYYEAATTGDTGLALYAMAEKIEHPKFKELVRNMEISIRYCADFSQLVNSSRRSLREYLRVSMQRKGMLQEAAINLFLLLIMSAVVLAMVFKMTGVT